MTRKKPWNRVNLPVYSISSKNKDRFNMHILVYVTAISMQPKRYICGIYHGTQTLEYVEANGEFILQLLAAGQYRLVDLLGKKSGRQVDKMRLLEKRDALTTWNGYPVLKNCLAVLQMKVISSFDGGDHKGFVCEVQAYKNMADGDTLTLDILREHKMIRM